MSTTTTRDPATPPTSRLDSFFAISQRGSSVGREVRGGLVTFVTMAYIIVLHPLIIGTVTDVEGRYLGGGDAPNLALVAAATALADPTSPTFETNEILPTP